MSVRTLTIATAATVALLLTGCSGGGDDTADADSPTTEAAPSGEAPSDEPTEPDSGAAGGAVVPVGGTFGATYNGEFDFEYLGLVDIGTADGGSAGEIRCYGVGANVTLTAFDDFFDTGAIVVSSPRVLDADGVEVGAIQTLGCPRGYLDAGWVDLGNTEFPQDQEGTAVDDVILTVVGVPLGDVDKAAVVSIPGLTSAPVLAFEVTTTL